MVTADFTNCIKSGSTKVNRMVVPMQTKHARLFAVLGLVFFLVTWLIPYVLPTDQVAEIVKEDHLIEYLSFFGLFFAGIAWLITFVRSNEGHQLWRWHTQRNFVYLAIALLLLFGAGEEITWGQRILGFSTPDTFQGNEQGEASIHNMPMFNSTNKSNPFQMNRMFNYWCLAWGILVPLTAKFSRKARSFWQTFGVPVMPLIIGAQFLLNYVMFKLYEPLGMNLPQYDGRLLEIREAQDAFLLAMVATGFLLSSVYARRHVTVPETSAMAPAAAR
jgi:hypothetical protein